MHLIITGTVDVRVIHSLQNDTLPCGIETQLMVDPEPSTQPACTALPWAHKQLPTHSGKHNNAQYARAHNKRHDSERCHHSSC